MPSKPKQPIDAARVTEDDPKMFLIDDLVRRWRVSRKTILREIARKRLVRKLIGSQVRFPAAEVYRYERMAG